MTNEVRAVIGYCMKCREKCEMVNPQPTMTRNKRAAIDGNCPRCNTRIVKMGKMPS